ncbi:TetR family transcriptional regulator [Naasia aerilata]|uniref:TetR family transcriptional regulator n=2 Tax=Naasia aerilata TaxID=1162966 RepID=A0ABM8GAP3_9MICO|nr:TetR family transcriptional regulator [Naasia aerilata]
MSSADRRESILQAATAVFGARSYVGATTDDVARAAGVSQPYVVRLFGTKEKLFLAVLDRAVQLLLAAFRSAAEGPEEGRLARMGGAYVGLLSERGLLQTLSTAFLLGGDPAIGPAARRCFSEVWGYLRDEVGVDLAEAQSFLANGMLINTIVGLRLIDDYDTDPRVTELFDELCMPEKAEIIQQLAPRGSEPW